MEIANLQQQSSQFLEDWGNKLARGQLAEAYLDTLEPAERPRLEEELQRRQRLVPFLALVTTMGVPPSARPSLLVWVATPDSDELARQLFLPGYTAQFPRHGILQLDKFREPDVDIHDHIVNALKGFFRPLRTGDPRLLGLRPSPSSGYRTWKIDGQRIRLPHDCKLAIAVDGKMRYSVDVTITVESDPGPIIASRKPAWRIISVEPMHGEDAARNPRMPGQAAF
jgi:hypothetical protein